MLSSKTFQAMEKIKGFIVALEEDQRIICYTNIKGTIYYFLRPWNVNHKGEEVYVTWKSEIKDIISEFQDTIFQRKDIDNEILKRMDDFILLEAEIEDNKITLL